MPKVKNHFPRYTQSPTQYEHFHKTPICTRSWEGLKWNSFTWPPFLSFFLHLPPTDYPVTFSFPGNPKLSKTVAKCHFPHILQTEKRHLIFPKVLPILKASMNPTKHWCLPKSSDSEVKLHYPIPFSLGGSTTPSLSVWVGPLPHPFQSGWVHYPIPFSRGGSTTPFLSVGVGPLPHPFQSGWVHYPIPFSRGGSTTPSPLSVGVGPLPHPFHLGWVHYPIPTFSQGGSTTPSLSVGVGPLPHPNFHSGWVHYPIPTFSQGGSTTPSLSVGVGPLPHPDFHSGWVHYPFPAFSLGFQSQWVHYPPPPPPPDFSLGPRQLTTPPSSSNWWVATLEAPEVGVQIDDPIPGYISLCWIKVCTET